jgi:hypothetical protein
MLTESLERLYSVAKLESLADKVLLIANQISEMQGIKVNNKETIAVLQN